MYGSRCALNMATNTGVYTLLETWSSSTVECVSQIHGLIIAEYCQINSVYKETSLNIQSEFLQMCALCYMTHSSEWLSII